MSTPKITLKKSKETNGYQIEYQTFNILENIEHTYLGAKLSNSSKNNIQGLTLWALKTVMIKLLLFPKIKIKTFTFERYPVRLVHWPQYILIKVQVPLQILI